MLSGEKSSERIDFLFGVFFFRWGFGLAFFGWGFAFSFLLFFIRLDCWTVILRHVGHHL
jgi:hypothetical protein